MSDADTAPEAGPAEGKELAKPTRSERKLERQVKKDKGDRKGAIARLVLFFRQVVAELRKVIWPTRKELINYTWVVLVFVTAMAALIGVMDFVFAKGVLTVFGS